MNLNSLTKSLSKSGYAFLGEGNNWGTGFEVVFQNEEDSSDIVKITVEQTDYVSLAEQSWDVTEMNFAGMSDEDKNPPIPEQEEEVPDVIYVCDSCDEIHHDETDVCEHCPSESVRVVSKGDLGFF